MEKVLVTGAEGFLGYHTIKLLNERHKIKPKGLVEVREEDVIKYGLEKLEVEIISSSLTVGLNQQSQPLNEAADWTKHQFNLPYALSRRKAEQESLAIEASGEPPVIVAINPSFTMGPEDYINAPANQLAKLMSQVYS